MKFFPMATQAPVIQNDILFYFNTEIELFNLEWDFLCKKLQFRASRFNNNKNLASGFHYKDKMVLWVSNLVLLLCNRTVTINPVSYFAHYQGQI